MELFTIYVLQLVSFIDVWPEGDTVILQQFANKLE